MLDFWGVSFLHPGNGDANGEKDEVFCVWQSWELACQNTSCRCQFAKPKSFTWCSNRFYHYFFWHVISEGNQPAFKENHPCWGLFPLFLHTVFLRLNSRCTIISHKIISIVHSTQTISTNPFDGFLHVPLKHIDLSIQYPSEETDRTVDPCHTAHIYIYIYPHGPSWAVHTLHPHNPSAWPAKSTWIIFFSQSHGQSPAIFRSKCPYNMAKLVQIWRNSRKKMWDSTKNTRYGH